MAVRFPIRAKLALALLIPILAVLAVSLFEVSQATAARDRVQRDTDLAGAAVGPAGLIRSLEYEQGDSAAGDRRLPRLVRAAHREPGRDPEDGRRRSLPSSATRSPRSAPRPPRSTPRPSTWSTQQLAEARKAYDENDADPDAEPGTIEQLPAEQPDLPRLRRADRSADGRQHPPDAADRGPGAAQRRRDARRLEPGVRELRPHDRHHPDLLAQRRHGAGHHEERRHRPGRASSSWTSSASTSWPPVPTRERRSGRPPCRRTRT